MGKDNIKRKTFTNGIGRGVKQSAKKQQKVSAQAKADELRQQGYHVRRNRVHTATPPPKPE